MIETADVVVVGGGVMGYLAAHHVLRQGASKVMLLERDDTFSGTSSAAAGFVSVWAVSAGSQGAQEARLEDYGLGFYADLAQRHAFDFRRNGLLWVAGSEAAREAMQHMVGHWAEPGTTAVTGSDVTDLTFGHVRGDRTNGGVLQPSGAQLTGPRLGTALRTELESVGGAVIHTREPVLGILRHGDRVTGVFSAHRKVHANVVVIAAGAWNNAFVQRELGFALPVVPHVATRIISAPSGISTHLPALFLTGIDEHNHGGNVLWVRQHERGLLFGGMYSGYPRDLYVDAEVPARFDATPIDGMQEELRRAAQAERLLPALAEVRHMRVAHGAPCYTPDRLPLLGPVPGWSGVHVMAGDNEFGVTHAAGLARILAEELDGTTQPWGDISRYRLDRFRGRFETARQVQQGVETMLTSGNDGLTLTQ